MASFADNDRLLDDARKYEKNLLNFFYRQGVSYSDGQDLVQETYLRLWRYREKYEPTAKLTTFLFTLARQVRIDAFRREKRRREREEAWAKERPTAVIPGLRGARDDVRWALSQLPAEMAEVVELGVFQDLPYAQIAEILSIPTGTVKSRMFNALRKLKEVFCERRS